MTAEAEGETLLQLSATAQATLQAIGRGAGSTLRLSPLCHEHPAGQRDVRGWVLDVPGHLPAAALPLSCSLFDGVTVVRCESSEAEVLDLLRNEGDTRRRLGAAVAAAAWPRAEAERASWRRCRPTAAGHSPSLRGAEVVRSREVRFFQPPESVPVLDSEGWAPELSPDGFVGLYHRWHGAGGERRLSLYAVCQSYLPKACLELAELARGGAGTAAEVCLSEEVDWVRAACGRNRARLVAAVCDAMGIRVPAMLDPSAAQPAPRMAVATTETLHQDLVAVMRGGGRPGVAAVRVLNHCAETERACNGTACVLAPWDGVWILHGADADGGDGGGGEFGGAYGGRFFLPTATARLAERVPKAARAGTALGVSSAHLSQCPALHVWGARATQVVVAGGDAGPEQGEEPPEAAEEAGLDPDVRTACRRTLRRRAAAGPLVLPNVRGVGEGCRHFLAFDEAVLVSMARRGWPRAHGATALIPMAVALGEQRAVAQEQAQAQAQASEETPRDGGRVAAETGRPGTV